MKYMEGGTMDSMSNNTNYIINTLYSFNKKSTIE